MEGGAVGHNFERDPPKDHPCQVWCNLVQQFQRRRCHKPMFEFSYVFSNGSHLGWGPMSSDTILKGDHIRTIPPRFGPDWPSSFRGEEFSIFSNSGHLGWRPGSSNTILKGGNLRTIPPKFGLKWLSGFREDFYLIFC